MVELRRILLRNCGILLSALSLGACGHQKMTVADLDKRISEAVPVGTQQTRVLELLDSLKLQHSAFDERTRSIAAMVADSATKGVVTRSFHIALFFDASGKLSSHTTKELFTGP